MKNFFTIGDVTPWGEECVQVSKDWDYLPAMQDQCNKYIEMLQHRFKNIINQTGVYLRQRANSHDFGTYLSIEVVFDDDNKDQVKAALFVEKNMPEFWNDDKVFEYSTSNKRQINDYRLKTEQLLECNMALQVGKDGTITCYKDRLGIFINPSPANRYYIDKVLITREE